MENYIKQRETNVFEKCMQSYVNPIDISRCFSRAQIYSYSPESKYPIVFRHYKHPVNNISAANHHSGIRVLAYSRITIYIQGKIRMLINDVAYSLSYGDVIIQRKNDEDITHYLKREELEYYEFEFPNEFLGHDDRNIFFPFLSQSTSEKYNVISPSKKEASMLFEILEEFDEEANNPTEYSDFILYSLLIKLGVILTKMHSKETHENLKEKIDPVVQGAVRFISKNFKTIEKIEEVADSCGISVSYLCRIFKERLGITPTEYINRIRINFAKKILKSGATVTEACYESGFNNYGYFITYFKKVVGTSPAKYKKS